MPSAYEERSGLLQPAGKPGRHLTQEAGLGKTLLGKIRAGGQKPPACGLCRPLLVPSGTTAAGQGQLPRLGALRHDTRGDCVLTMASSTPAQTGLHQRCPRPWLAAIWELRAPFRFVLGGGLTVISPSLSTQVPVCCSSCLQGQKQVPPDGFPWCTPYLSQKS